MSVKGLVSGLRRAYRYRMSGQAILLVGNDTFRLAERAKGIVDGLLPGGSRAVGLETIDGRVDGVEALRVLSATSQALMSVSLFGGNRVVWLRDAEFLAEKAGDRGSDDEQSADQATPAPSKAAVANLATCIKNGMPEGLTFLLTAPAIDRRSALYRAFDSAGRVESLEISEKPWEAEKQARKFLDEQIGRHHLSMSEDARRSLLERTGADTLAMAAEIEKLSLHGEDGSVTVADVTSVVASSREAIVWELTDAIGARDVGGAFAVLRQLLFQGESPMAIIVVIEGYFRQLAVVRDIIDRKWAVLGARELEWRRLDESETAMLEALGKMDLRKMHPYRALKLAQQASRRTSRDIRRCRRTVLSAHERLVSSSMPPQLTLDFLLRQLLA